MSRGRYALLVFAGSTITGLFFAVQAYFNPAVRGMITWSIALAINLTYYYFYGMAVPLVVYLGRRFPFEQRKWARSLAVHVLASIVLTAIILILVEATLTFIVGIRMEPFGSFLPLAFKANYQSLLPTYWLILAAFLAFQYYAKYRDRELRASQLEAHLADARLAALQMQLRPHFLFNTLNSISSLIYSDRDSADAMLTRLAEFLRMTIATEAEQLVPLTRELEFVRRYLDIEQIRLEDRLRVAYDIEPAASDALVPNLLLQPLVENAIHHGVAPREEGGTISIRAAAADGRLRLSVTDDGPGLSEPGPERMRVGLGNTQARLEQLYGRDYDLKLAARAGGGVIVEITMPLQKELSREP